MKKKKKLSPGRIYHLCPARHILLLVSAVIIAAHLLTRGNHDLNAKLSQSFVRPVHRFLAAANDHLHVSVAEVLIALAVLALLLYILIQIVMLVKRTGRGARAYRTVITLLLSAASVYAGFCVLWGVFYYGDDFAEASGLSDSPVSVEQLESVTRYFADQANYWSDKIERDDHGYCGTDRAEVLEKSAEVFENTVGMFPCLAGPSVSAKGIYFSKVMSYLDFTGFFFPFTAEANVNTDFPPSLFASTVAHELSHQRGVAKEQEANFVAVLASLNFGDADYCYSACLLAYTHLGNALYSADYEAWCEIYESLDENIRKDFSANRQYWKQFETPVQTVSNTVYEGFLQSYDQKLGMRSYGACVDLLVNYYYEASQKG